MEFQAGRVNKTGEPKLASGLVFDKQKSPALSCLALKLGFFRKKRGENPFSKEERVSHKYLVPSISIHGNFKCSR